MPQDERIGDTETHSFNCSITSDDPELRGRRVGAWL